MEAFVHMTGYVGGDVEVRTGNVTVASFRLACTPRVRRGGDWADGNTTWITVTCFRSLAEHAGASIKKGDPVIVIGKLRTNVWTKNGETSERLTLDAITLGHDLSRGTADFRRTERVAVPEDREAEVGEVIDAVENQPYDDLEEPGAGRETRAA